MLQNKGSKRLLWLQKKSRFVKKVNELAKKTAPKKEPLKKNVCEFCKKSFSKPFNLNRHLKICKKKEQKKNNKIDKSEKKRDK